MAEAKDLKRIRRSSNKAMARLLLGVIKSGARYKMTRSGIMFFGRHGSCSTHLGCSEYRAAANFRHDLIRIGITPQEGT